jgi:ABC-type glycerol-3-phosphate transport system permease component
VLLLPVSPWLFATIIPLSLTAFQTMRGFSLLGTLPGLIPPLPISVPMVFVLTLFFKGQYPQWRAAQAAGKSALGSFLTQQVLPSLPLALGLIVVALLVGFQDLYWPLVVGTSAASRTMATTFLFLRGNLGVAPQSMLSAAVTLFELPLSVVFFLILGVMQCLYLDRLALTTSAQ